jgi:hypothetical protein
MTDSRTVRPDQAQESTVAAAAEVQPEPISDLDAPAEDTDNVRGGRCTGVNADAYIVGITYVNA